MELDPADPDILFFLAITYQAAGQIEPARALAARFYTADPLSSLAAMLVGVAEWFAGRPGPRIDALERALAMDPQNPIARWGLGYTYALVGRTADTAQHARWMVEHAPHLPYTVQLATLLDAIQGRRAEALQSLRDTDAVAVDAHQTFHLAESYAMAGDTSRALELLDWAVDNGFYPFRFYAEWCPFMEPLRGMPEFERIISKAARRVAEFSA
jgi:tetratricopeptide (TPR) repeat protein